MSSHHADLRPFQCVMNISGNMYIEGIKQAIFGDISRLERSSHLQYLCYQWVHFLTSEAAVATRNDMHRIELEWNHNIPQHTLTKCE